MQRGLEGRRIAITTPSGKTSDVVGVVESALKHARAEVEILTSQSETDAWHGGKYAALVLVGGAEEEALPKADPRLVQLVREFLVSEKPVAAHGSGVGVVVEAGGAAGRSLTAQGTVKAAVETAGGKVVSESVHADGCLISARGDTSIAEFSRVVVRELSRQLEEEDVDAMSAQSFPASDPPSTNPASAGPADRTDAQS